MALPRYRRRPINSAGKGSLRIQDQRRNAYAAVARRAKGQCELPGCGRRQDPLDPHHTFGRHSTDVPAALLESAELISGICRPCHERIHGQDDAELAAEARCQALERLAERYDIDVIATTDPLDDLRAMVRTLEARGA